MKPSHLKLLTHEPGQSKGSISESLFGVGKEKRLSITGALPLPISRVIPPHYEAPGQEVYLFQHRGCSLLSENSLNDGHEIPRARNWLTLYHEGMVQCGNDGLQLLRSYQ